MLYRQGDVLIQSTDIIPADAQPAPRDQGRIILAYGETTGHAHAITDRHAELLTLPDHEITDRFLRIVGSAAELVHEEHSAIVLPPGTYRVIRQREYTPQASVYVAD